MVPLIIGQRFPPENIDFTPFCRPAFFLDPIYLSSSPQSFFPPLLYTSVKIGSLLAKKKYPKTVTVKQNSGELFFCSFPQASMLVSQILSCYRLPVVSIFLRLHNWLRAISFLYQPLVFLWILKRSWKDLKPKLSWSSILLQLQEQHMFFETKLISKHIFLNLFL